jgi:uncharacterized protein (TIGR02996 family)
VTDRDLFLRALAEDEDDTTTRLVYADWLEEHDEYEEADRQRKWPAAKQWLLRLCKEEVSYYGSAPFTIPYEGLIAFGHRVVTEKKSSPVIHLRDDAVDEIGRALPGDRREFFRNWSIVTGIPLPADLEDKSFYWECCPAARFRIAMNGETEAVMGGVPMSCWMNGIVSRLIPDPTDERSGTDKGNMRSHR